MKIVALLALGVLVSACASTQCELPDLYEPIAHCDTENSECRWNAE